jgi:hypothetical protein
MTENHRYTLGANLANNETNNPFSANAKFNSHPEINSKLNNHVDYSNYYSNPGKKELNVTKSQIIDTLFDEEHNPKTIECVFGLDKQYENETFAQGFHIPEQDDKFTILENDSPVQARRETNESKYKQSEIKQIDDLISRFDNPDTERKNVTDIDFFDKPLENNKTPNTVYIVQSPHIEEKLDIFKPNGNALENNRNKSQLVQPNDKRMDNLDFFDTLKLPKKEELKKLDFFDTIKEEQPTIRQGGDRGKSNGINFDFFHLEQSGTYRNKPSNCSQDILNNAIMHKPQPASNIFDINSAIDFDKIQIDLKNDPLPSEKRYSSTANMNFTNKMKVDKQLKDFNSTHALRPRTVISLHNIEGEVSYGKPKHGKETTSSISLRKSKLLKDNIFSSSKGGFSNKNLTPYLELDKEVLNYQTQAIFEEIICNVNVNRIKEDFITFFLDENVHQSPISPLSNIDSMLEFTELSKVPGLKQTLSKDIHSWRMILGDGNCFYRAFMFALIESFILNRDLYNLRKLVFDINANLGMQLYKNNVPIDKSELNITFYLIIDYLENGSIAEAYDVFMKSYYYYKTFDYGLIKYMRIALYNYIDANKNKIFSSDSQLEIGNLLPAAYIVKDGYNFKGFFEEYLLCMHNEAEKIVIYLAPIVFNVNLDLFILEGTAQLQANNVQFFKQTLNSLNSKSKNISLLYRFNHYDCLYDHQTFRTHSGNISYQFDLNRKNRYTVFTECQCEVCGQQSELLSFYHIPNNPLCKTCLIYSINNIMINRINAYTSEFYINKECNIT